MRAQASAFAMHLGVGIAAVAVLLTSSPVEGFAPVFLFLVGVPWVAGFLAFYGLPRTRLAWVIPIVTLMIGLSVWLLALSVSGLD